MNFIRVVNQIAKLSLLGLFAWIIIFILDKILDFKILNNHQFEKFTLILVPIALILFGTLFYNLIFKITNPNYFDKHIDISTDSVEKKTSSKYTYIAILALAIISLSVFFYNKVSKRNKLINSGKSIISENKNILDSIILKPKTYQWYYESEGQIQKISRYLIENNSEFQDISIILKDTSLKPYKYIDIFDSHKIEDTLSYKDIKKDVVVPEKQYKLRTTFDQREYFEEVTKNYNDKVLLQIADEKNNNTELFIPYRVANRIVIIRFQAYSRDE